MCNGILNACVSFILQRIVNTAVKRNAQELAEDNSLQMRNTALDQSQNGSRAVIHSGCSLCCSETMLASGIGVAGVDCSTVPMEGGSRLTAKSNAAQASARINKAQPQAGTWIRSLF